MMIFRHEQRGTTWIDIEQPTPDEIHAVAKEFAIGERIETELLSPSPPSLVATNGEVALLVLHFPVHGEEDGESKKQEVDFVVGKQFVITVRYEVVAPIHRLRKLFETNELLETKTELSTDALLEILFAHLFASVRDHVDHVATRLNRIEEHMFNGKERETVEVVSKISREFLHLEGTVANQEEPLERFLEVLEKRTFFGADFRERLIRIQAGRSQLARLVATHRAAASEIRETNSALLNTAQNQIMKTLTVITFIMLPLELIAGLFQITVHGGMPFLNNPNGFWIIIAIMCAVGGSVTLVFARKRWL